MLNAPIFDLTIYHNGSQSDKLAAIAAGLSSSLDIPGSGSDHPFDSIFGKMDRRSNLAFLSTKLKETMDLSSYDLGALRNLLQDVKKEIERRQAEEIAKAKEQILAIAESVGVPLATLLQPSSAAKSKNREPAPIRFRNPANQAEGWSGRGRQPKWVKEWIESGKAIDELAV